MAGIKALFRSSYIMNSLEKFQKEADYKTLIGLRYIGERFVNKARSNNTYRDQTGNLRSSIGYVILKDGQIVEQNFLTGKNIGIEKGKQFAKKLSDLYPKGFVLVGVAGMEYARYVEAMNYDVITGSQPESNEIKSIFNEINI